MVNNESYTQIQLQAIIMKNILINSTKGLKIIMTTNIEKYNFYSFILIRIKIKRNI